MTNQKLIFVIDDDEMMCQMLADHLSQNPINQVKTFTSGEEAIKYLGESPKVVILDYILNGVNPDAADGIEILKQIRKYNEGIHVIMLSSQEHYGTALQTISQGAENYVIKDENAFSKVSELVEAIH